MRKRGRWQEGERRVKEGEGIGGTGENCTVLDSKRRGEGRGGKQTQINVF